MPDARCCTGAIAITPDGKAVYVTNADSGTATPIDTANNTAGKPVKAGASPVAIAITPDGKTAYRAAVRLHRWRVCGGRCATFAGTWSRLTTLADDEV